MSWPSPELCEALLDRTLVYAAQHVPFYRHLRGRTGLALEDFPVIDRDVVAARLYEFLAVDRFPDFLVSSGGTTDGRPNITFRNTEEYEAVHEHLTGLRPGEIPTLDSIREFAIDLFFNTNGHYWRKPRGWPLVSLVLEQPAHAEVVRRLITDGLQLAGRTLPAGRLQSQNGPLRTLTGYFWVTGFSPAEHQLRAVHGYGSHLSQTWRARLSEFWGAEVITSYGLMEFAVGGAAQCSACAGYHYRTAWPEFVALDGGGQVEEGDARLLLTSLVPFVHVQPRIRYDTADVVTVLGRCEATGQLGFVFRGRAASSAIGEVDGRATVLLSETDVIDVVDQIPGVGCRPHTSERQLWADPDLPHPPFRMGFPRFTVTPPQTGEPSCVRVALEADFDPAAEPRLAAALRDRFEETLHATLPDVPRRLAASGTALHLDVLAPGTLRLRTKSAA